RSVSAISPRTRPRASSSITTTTTGRSCGGSASTARRACSRRAPSETRRWRRWPGSTRSTWMHHRRARSWPSTWRSGARGRDNLTAVTGPSFGFSVPQAAAFRDGELAIDGLVAFVQHAESLGFRDLVVADHILVPPNWARVIGDVFLDAFTLLAYLAAE